MVIISFIGVLNLRMFSSGSNIEVVVIILIVFEFIVVLKIVLII